MHKTHLSFFIIAVALGACQKDFLEITPASQANAENFYKTPDDMLAAVNATYSVLQDGNQYGGAFMTVIETRSDNVEDNDPAAGGGRRYRLDRFQETATNDILQDVWGSIYQGVFRANTVLNRIESVKMDESLRNRYSAEVRFIRALSYFNLVRLWGNVPLILEAESPEEVRETAIRNPVSEVYTAIEADLQFAASHLPAAYEGSDLGRVTAGAANTLLGKMYLTLGQYPQAVNILQPLVGAYQLQDSVGSVFTANNELNREIIFAVRFRKDQPGEDHGSWYGITIVPNLTPGLLNAYSPQDRRLPLLEFQQISPSSAVSVPRKFYDEPYASDRFGNDFPVLRYADVLLMLAEALNETGYTPDGDALRYLNQVRTRAGLPPYTAAELPGQESFRQAVWAERRLELALENHRWFDLLRTNRAQEAMAVAGISLEPYQTVYPVPQWEIDVFNDPESFPQNTGY